MVFPPIWNPGKPCSAFRITCSAKMLNRHGERLDSFLDTEPCSYVASCPDSSVLFTVVQVLVIIQYSVVVVRSGYTGNVVVLRVACTK